MLKTLRPRRTAPSMNAEPNMIPFIDVLLVMLVIFLVASPAPSTDLAVNLPPTGAKARIAVMPVIVGASVRDGAVTLSIEGQDVAAAEFRTRLLDAARARNPALDADPVRLFREARIVLDADQALDYAAVYGVVDEIGAAGFRKVDLMVESAT